MGACCWEQKARRHAVARQGPRFDGRGRLACTHVATHLLPSGRGRHACGRLLALCRRAVRTGLAGCAGGSRPWHLALRPKLTLYEDAVYIRGQILSRVIPITEVSAVQAGYGGLDIWWGNGRMSEASAIGEQTNIDGLPGSDGRRHTMSSLILATRNTYLNQHGLTARPDPREEDERRRANSCSAVGSSTTLRSLGTPTTTGTVPDVLIRRRPGRQQAL